MKTISIFLALINSLLAGLLITYSLTATELRQVETWWFAVKTAGALMVIALGTLTWYRSISDTGTGILLLGGVFLIVLGVTTILWTFHLAIVSGDMEYYMVGYGGSLMTQGMASLLSIGAERGSMTIS